MCTGGSILPMCCPELEVCDKFADLPASTDVVGSSLSCNL